MKRLTVALFVLLPTMLQAEPWRVVYLDASRPYHKDLSIPSSSVIYVVGGGGSNAGFILKSEDGGDSWVPKYSTPPEYLPPPGINAIDCQSDLICYAGGDDGWVYKTVDGGEGWAPVQLRDADDNTFQINDIKVVNGAEGIVVAVGARGIIKRRSVVGGVVRWDLIPSSTSVDLNGVHFNGDIGYISGNDRVVLKSINGGASWSTVSVPASLIGSCGDVFTLDGEKIWVGCSNVGKSEDGAESFSVAGTGYVWPQSSIAFTSSSNGWVLNGLFGAYIRKTTDGGVTWPDFMPGITIPDTLSDSERAILDDITILNSDGTRFTTSTQFREIEFQGSSLGFIVGDGVIARRQLPVYTVGGTDNTITLYPNLIPAAPWSHACSNASGMIYSIIAGVQNVGQAGVAPAQLPFFVRFEALDGDGNPIAGASRDYPISAFTADADGTTAMIDFTEGGTVSASDLYQLFNPTGVSTIRLRMTVDATNVVREAEDVSGAWENDNVVADRTVVCGPVVERLEDAPQPAPPPRPSGEKDKKKKSDKKKQSKWKK